MADINEQVSEALSHYLADSGGGMVTAYYLVSEIIDAEGEQGWLYVTPDQQPLIRTLGLIEWGRNVARYEQTRYHDGEQP